MKMAYNIFRVEKVKTMSSLGGLYAHHTRKQNVANANPDGPKPKYLWSGRQDLLAHTKQCLPEKLRKNGVIAMDFVLTASPEFFAESTKEQKREWVLQSKKWLEKEFGQCVQAVLHQDEKTLHIQGFIVPNNDWTPGAKISADRYFNPDSLIAYQDSLFEHMNQAGFKLDRGLKGSTAVHTTNRQYQDSLNKAMAGEVADDKQTLQTQVKALTNELQITRNEAAVYKAQAAQANYNNKINELRSVDLQQLAIDLGAVKQREKNLYKFDGVDIYITSEKFNSFKNQEWSGGGAIDFLVKVAGYKTAEAINYLEQKYSTATAQQQTVVKAVNNAKNVLATVKSTPPTPVPNNWQAVKQYLVHTRALSSTLVDSIASSGKAYADKFFNFVMLNDNTGATLRSTKGKVYKQSRGQRDLTTISNTVSNTSNEVYITESVIDSLSCLELFNCKQAISTAGTNAELAIKAIKQVLASGLTPVLAYDSDEQGQKVVKDVLEQYPDLKVAKPDGKDFNQDLQAHKQQQAKEEHQKKLADAQADAQARLKKTVAQASTEQVKAKLNTLTNQNILTNQTPLPSSNETGLPSKP
jgi:5S rRNA maturation endonuclease (ribonuclease M5)